MLPKTAVCSEAALLSHRVPSNEVPTGYPAPRKLFRY